MFTKITADMVAGDAPDAFQDSVQYYPSYAKQGQLLPLDLGHLLVQRQPQPVLGA